MQYRLVRLLGLSVSCVDQGGSVNRTCKDTSQVVKNPWTWFPTHVGSDYLAPSATLCVLGIAADITYPADSY